MSVLTSSSTYVAWPLLNAAVLLTAYVYDPYVFAFTQMGLAGATALVGVVGVGVCIYADTPTATAKTVILSAIALAAALHAAAFALLRTFNWA